MTIDKPATKDKWIWVIIIAPGEGEQILGQEDAKTKEAYIPFFPDKDQANQCYHLLAKEARKKYEVSAMLYEELVDHARTSGFVLYRLDGNGTVEEKVLP